MWWIYNQNDLLRCCVVWNSVGHSLLLMNEAHRGVLVYCYKKEIQHSLAQLNISDKIGVLLHVVSLLWRDKSGRESGKQRGAVSLSDQQLRFWASVTFRFFFLFFSPAGRSDGKEFGIDESVTWIERRPASTDWKDGVPWTLRRGCPTACGPLEVREEILGTQMNDKRSDGPRLVEGIVNEKTTCSEFKKQRQIEHDWLLHTHTHANLIWIYYLFRSLNLHGHFPKTRPEIPCWWMMSLFQVSEKHMNGLIKSGILWHVP